MANMADITTAAASDPGSPRESAPPPRGRASPFPSLPPSSPFPSLACPPTLSAARPARGSVLSPGRPWGEGAAAALGSAAGALAGRQVPGAPVNPRPRACASAAASASAAPAPRSLGARRKRRAQHSGARIRERAEVRARERATTARASAATPGAHGTRKAPCQGARARLLQPPARTAPEERGVLSGRPRGADPPGVAAAETLARSPPSPRLLALVPERKLPR